MNSIINNILTIILLAWNTAPDIKPLVNIQYVSVVQHSATGSNAVHVRE